MLSFFMLFNYDCSIFTDFINNFSFFSLFLTIYHYFCQFMTIFDFKITARASPSIKIFRTLRFYDAYRLRNVAIILKRVYQSIAGFTKNKI